MRSILEFLVNGKINKVTYEYHPNNLIELKKIIKDRILKEGPTCDLNDIDVSKITDMSYLFADSDFNGNIHFWNTIDVTDMSHMFANSKFNGDISCWNVSNVKTMNSMFANSEFNGDISKWEPIKCNYALSMFYNSKFNGDISNWKMPAFRFKRFMENMFKGSELEKNNKLPSWYK